MLVAISLRQEKNKHGNHVDVLESAYTSFFNKLEVTLIPIPNDTENVKNFLESLPIEGIIIAGGNDIDPTSFGGEMQEGLSLAPIRDLVEKELLQFAIKKKLPVLGICRGMQFINTFFGGKVIDLRKDHTHQPGKSHPIAITAKQDLFGNHSSVNSFHNWGITQTELAEPLEVFAKHEEIIEGIYHPTLPIIGVQWHPERDSQNEELNKKIIELFKGTHKI
jgi:N5-(cytidine 5'-diphosphoramidyl)-L-glutamine hydrolase